ncbi:hypothetical protein G7Y89_g9988 [Cudoniella acicularis]|uniref:Peptidase S8/S53 domain-containing protein n=1 Tax=Cudoniella acicularis TaxID=354080 RepID=A0A8H4RDL3_9HELO|nr:hypothetical protein G7Y89_g9988 [Cudoniella acicularis]
MLDNSNFDEQRDAESEAAINLATSDSVPLLHTNRTLNSLLYLSETIHALRPTLPQSNAAQTAKRAFSLFLKRLDSEIGIFQTIVSDLADSSKCVDDSDKAEWLTMEQTIRGRCDSYYGRYLDSLSQMLLEVRSIAELAGLDDDEAPWAQEELAFSSKPEHQKAVAKDAPIDWYSAKGLSFLLAICSVDGSFGGAIDVHLSRITETNQAILAVQKMSSAQPTHAHFRKLRSLRAELLGTADILGETSGFDCTCVEPHSVYLHVKQDFEEIPTSENSNEHLREHFCSLVFHNPNQPSDSTIPTWSWVVMQSEIIEAESLSRKVTFDTPRKRVPKEGQAGSKLHGALASSSPQSKKEKPGFLRVAGDFIKGKAKKSAPEIETPKRLTTNPPIGLCPFIATYKDSGSHSQIPSGQSSEPCIQLHWSDIDSRLQLSPDMLASDYAKTWAQILPVRRHFTGRGFPALSMEQKLRLAVKVASSLFYLHHTPWLEESWNSEDIFLIHQEGNNPLINPLLLLQHPQARPASASNSGSAQEPSELTSVLEPTIFGLGKLLVELWYGASWDTIREAFLPNPDMEEREDLGPSGDLVIVNKILSWAANPSIALNDQPFHLEGQSYLNAVQSCFQCDFGQRRTSLEDDEFKLQAYMRILCPLRHALEDYYIQEEKTFGPRETDEINFTSSSDPASTTEMRLFDDEKVEGVQAKSDSADNWFKEYAMVKKIAKTIRKRPQNPAERIRVAVLDTGIDVSDDFLHRFWTKRQIIYQNFVPGGLSTEHPQDDVGHGTYIASILFKMAENVDLYVARVSPDGKTWSNEQVEKAIKWAVKEKGVHIISISFGFPRLDESLEPIRRAILEAHASDVLIFAAASNKGKNHPMAFPACMDEVISVGSTDGVGKVSEFTPELGPGKRICAIGEAIQASWPRKLSKDGKTSMDRKFGTSYATPVVAGFAAMLMDCVWSVKDKNMHEARTLRSKRGMLTVLGHVLTKDTQHPVQFLQPWNLFNVTQNGQKVGPKGELGSHDNGIVTMIILTLRNVYSSII